MKNALLFFTAIIFLDSCFNIKGSGARPVKQCFSSKTDESLKTKCFIAGGYE